jgi:hypothetical protein
VHAQIVRVEQRLHLTGPWKETNCPSVGRKKKDSTVGQGAFLGPDAGIETQISRRELLVWAGFHFWCVKVSQNMSNS